jgi:lipopolysaccharide export system protein LptC
MSGARRSEPAALSPRAARSFASGAADRTRRSITLGAIARRRFFVNATKFLLPLLALALLTLMAIWPELDRQTRQAQVAFRRIAAAVEGASMVNARYRGADERGRPYTMTADVARQVSQGRFNLVEQKGDTTLENGTWLMVQSHEGVFLQQSNQLDLSRDVILYRDDGMTLRTPAMAVDLKAGAAASAEPVHIEGPLGTLDAQGFVMFDKGSVIQFTGPARMVMNGTER